MHLSSMPGMPNMTLAEMTAVAPQSAPTPAAPSQTSPKPGASQSPGVGGNLDVSA